MDNAMMHALVLFRLRIVLAAALLLCGCGGTDTKPDLVTVEGTVLWNGSPLEGAEVALHPDFPGPGWLPSGTTDTQGHFTIGTLEPGDGAPPGPYRATVVWRPTLDASGEGPNRLPARYANPNTSGLEVAADNGVGAPVVFHLTGRAGVGKGL
jgi:hypothetical protein